MTRSQRPVKRWSRADSTGRRRWRSSRKLELETVPWLPRALGNAAACEGRKKTIPFSRHKRVLPPSTITSEGCAGSACTDIDDRLIPTPCVSSYVSLVSTFPWFHSSSLSFSSSWWLQKLVDHSIVFDSLKSSFGCKKILAICGHAYFLLLFLFLSLFFLLFWFILFLRLFRPCDN